MLSKKASSEEPVPEIKRLWSKDRKTLPNLLRSGFGKDGSGILGHRKEEADRLQMPVWLAISMFASSCSPHSRSLFSIFAMKRVFDTRSARLHWSARRIARRRSGSILCHARWERYSVFLILCFAPLGLTKPATFRTGSDCELCIFHSFSTSWAYIGS